MNYILYPFDVFIFIFNVLKKIVLLYLKYMCVCVCGVVLVE